MSTPTQDMTTAISLTCLSTGEMVEARQMDGRVVYHGEVDIVVPQQEILWILHGALKERKLLDTSEYQIHQHLPTVK